MGVPCGVTACKGEVPPELETSRLCVSHFTVSVERACNDMRLETGRAATTPERRAEIIRYLMEQGSLLARVATGSARLPDEMKGRILSTFLTLMNLRENVERAAARVVPPAQPKTATKR